MNSKPMHILKNRWLSILLVPLSLLYRIIINLRNSCYDWQIIRSFSIPDCKVISIGNISVGGTGKTPAVEFLVNYLAARGKRVVILSRGYRRESKGTQVVSDGQHRIDDYRKCGDEPYLLARHLPNIPVIVEKDRYAAGLFIKARFNPEYLILDDAFQHRRLRRDVDIVLIDSTKAFGKNFMLPFGLLREPLSGLKRADIIWLTRSDQTDKLALLIAEIRKYTAASIITTVHRPHSLLLLGSEQPLNPEILKSRRVFIFSGIGNPEAFHKTISQLYANIVGEFTFRDHHNYCDNDLRAIQKMAIQTNAEWIITTEKDAVRITRLPSMEPPIYYLTIELTIRSGLEKLNKILHV